MNRRIFFLIICTFLLLAGFLISSCDKLVTETNEITRIDTTLGQECFSCHSDNNNPFLRPKGQWDNSAHALSVRYLDKNIALNDSSFNISTCGPKCHTHEGFLITFDSINFSPVGYSGLTCFTCHMPHSGTYKDWAYDTLRALNYSSIMLASGRATRIGKSNMCIHCHQAVDQPGITETNEDQLLSGDWGPHFSPQADMLTGAGAFFAISTLDASVHRGNNDDSTGGCIMCHYGVINDSVPTGEGYEYGEHTFRLQDISGNDTSQFVNNCNITGCHDGVENGLALIDPDGFYKFPKIDTILEKAAILDSILTEAGILDAADTTRGAFNGNLTIKASEARVLYNYLFYTLDGSNGVHNPTFALAVLDSSINRWTTIPRSFFTNDAADSNSCFPQLPIQFNFDGTGDITSFTWLFDDGTTLDNDSNPVHIYAPGRFLPYLIVDGPQGDDTSFAADSLIIYGPPAANFLADTRFGCYADSTDTLAVTFDDISTGNVTGWTWFFGDGSSSTEAEPVHVYRDIGSYTCTLIVTNKCDLIGDTLVKDNYVILFDDQIDPVADFTSDVTVVQVDNPVTFTNLSTNAATYEWEFGDDETSTLPNPVHVYQIEGTYTVSLKAINPCGEATETKTNYIVVNPAPKMSSK